MRIPPTSAARGVLVLFLGLLLAAVLDAEGLRKQAQIQPQGTGRRIALALTEPLVSFSRALHLTTPRHELQVAIGRQDEDRIDTTVHLTLPPPAGPAPGHGSNGGLHTGTHTSPAARRIGTHTSPPKPKPVFTAAHPLKVWVAGDSLAQLPGDGLERVAGNDVAVVAIESRLDTGLSRPDLYNWFTRIPQAVAQYHPNVVVLSFGADDAHDYMAGLPAGRTVGPFGSPSWVAEYYRRAEGVTRELVADGVYVVWLGLPIPDGPGFGHTFPVVNRILERVVKNNAGRATYVDDWDLFAGARGQYTPYKRVHGKYTLLRLSDGVHYTDAGGDLVATQVLKQLRGVFSLR
ncbi:MAG TPA: DUF459 domain-containing protein [Gaiellaceae bacterium]|nr:DUF459 domain-containing protein [Gaiellaceae bacterium]